MSALSTLTTIRKLAIIAALALAAGLLDAGQRAATAAEEVTAEVTTLEAGTTAYGALVAPRGGLTYQQQLASSEQRYGGRLGVVRYFDSNYPDSWTYYTSLMGDRDVNISFRISPTTVNSGSADSRLRSWFASAPTDRTIYWTYMHEPEDDIQRGAFTAAAFRTAWARIAAIAREANKPNLHATLVLMCWTVEPASGRNWLNYYSPGDVDVIGWDCYNGGWRRGVYADPVTNIFPRPIAASRSVGLPWAIAELGSIRVPSDTTGEGRAAWITRAVQHLHSEGAEYVAWFDTTTSTSDYRLLDEPSRQAWFDAVSDQDPFATPAP